MSAISLGWAVTAVVSAAAGDAAPAAMLPAGIGLALLALAYAWSVALLMERRRATLEPI
jgi:hypothetical protein